jgi:UDP-N-acetylglucosamine 2-epimerase (non-hydrolysing)/GDP/UDP-N,N'-diacetylbacillosamine 2-epimerase (hydrolysing)
MGKRLQMRKIAVITGTRAEYGLLKPIILKILDDPFLELQLFVTGTHLAKEFGYTIDEIIADNIPIKAKIDAIPLADTGYAMASAISKLLAGLIQKIKTDRPNIILILGDRGEPLAAAIAGIYSNIPIAHIHGGEVSGNVDEPVRHAISKLSHIHFPATQAAANRLTRMGEDKKHIFVCGAPGLDTILKAEFLSRQDLYNKLNLDPNNDFIVVLQHPVTTEYVPGQAASQINITLKAVKQLGIQSVIIYPNSDAGGREMIKEIDKLAGDPQFRIFKNLPSKLYHSLLKYASLLVGNSSSGIIEAPSYNLPVINIGTRQHRRERAENVINVEQDTKKIFQTAEKILTDESLRKRLNTVQNPYGDGTASEKIVKILKEIKITPDLLQKTNSY